MLCGPGLLGRDYVDNSGWEFRTIPALRTAECWDYRHATLCPALENRGLEMGEGNEYGNHCSALPRRGQKYTREGSALFCTTCTPEARTSGFFGVSRFTDLKCLCSGFNGDILLSILLSPSPWPAKLTRAALLGEKLCSV